MRKFFLLLMVITFTGMTGCASQRIERIDPAQVNETVRPDEAALVFYQSMGLHFTPKSFIPFVGPSLSQAMAPIMETNEDGKLTPITYIITGCKFFHKTTPGKHFYLLGGNPVEILEANLEAGKTYYVRISQSSGLNIHFDFHPVTDPANDLPKEINSRIMYPPMKNTPAGEQRLLEDKASLQAESLSALKRHNEENLGDKKIIRPEYGIIAPAQ